MSGRSPIREEMGSMESSKPGASAIAAVVVIALLGAAGAGCSPSGTAMASDPTPTAAPAEPTTIPAEPTTSAGGAHDHAGGAHGRANGTHDHAGGTHDRANGAHDHASGTHDHASGAHSRTNGAHDHASGAHGRTNGAHDHASGTQRTTPPSGTHSRTNGAHDHASGAHDHASGAHDHASPSAPHVAGQVAAAGFARRPDHGNGRGRFPCARVCLYLAGRRPDHAGRAADRSGRPEDRDERARRRAGGEGGSAQHRAEEGRARHGRRPCVPLGVGRRVDDAARRRPALAGSLNGTGTRSRASSPATASRRTGLRSWAS